MGLSTGVKLGPYEVMQPVGAGGMGEVYRARDPRLGREVAIKILPASFSADPNRLRRFEQEARAAAALNHPNILAVYDVGTREGSPYIVSELLEGETLRERLRLGAIPVRKAVDYALQIARGLAAAHDKGIVHRDLKPENIFVSKDGRVKILDFGLAKLVHTDANNDDMTRTLQSEAGTVIGTVGYMSPEQVRGKTPDVRTDLFSFGAILYEMLAGERAFKGDTAADTMTAILTKDPPELTQSNAQVPTALDHIVRHCLEKAPEERFQSAHDIAFNLEMLSSASGTATSQAVPVLAPRRRRGWAPLAAIAALALIAGGILVGRSSVGSPPMSRYNPLTFQRGTVYSARYAPDGHTIIYSAAWEGERRALFSVRSDSPGSVPLGIPNADVVSISRNGEMALITNARFAGGWVALGTLARAPLNGGSPRPVLEEVQDADWSRDGTDFVVTHYVGQHFRLEYPIGTVLYETQGWISHPRFSPKGDKIAFLDHPVYGDDLGSVAVIDLAGNKKVLSTGWASVRSLAWSPTGDELWFAAAKGGSSDAVYAVTLSGRQRIVARLLPDLQLMDVTADGHALLAHHSERFHMFVRGPGQEKDRDLAYLDWTRPAAISTNGEYVLFEEQGVGGGPQYATYLRKTDGSPPLRLGDGGADALSPDGNWAVSHTLSSPGQLRLMPIGAGQPRQITNDSLNHQRAEFLPGDRILFTGTEPGHQSRIYVQSLEQGAKPEPVTPEGVSLAHPSADGKYLVARFEHNIVVCALADCSHPQVVPGLGDLDFAETWTSDNRHVLFSHYGVPNNVTRVDPWTGKSEPFKSFAPPDPAGVDSVGPILITPDGRYYAYGVFQVLSTLYKVDRLK